MKRNSYRLKSIGLSIITVLTITSLIFTASMTDVTTQPVNEESHNSPYYRPSAIPIEPLWTYTYNGPSYGDSQFESVIQLSNGDFAAAGSQMVDTAMDWFTIRTNESGGGSNEGQDWTDSRGTSGSEYAFSITQATSGNDVVVTGHFLNNEKDISLKRLDSTGTSVWTRIFSEDYNQIPYEIISSSSGGFALVGSSESSVGAPPDALLLRTYETGYEDWRVTFGAVGADEIFSVVECSNGDFVLAGYTQSYGGADQDLWVIRVDNTGTEIWNRVYGGTFDDWGEEIIQCSDGGFAIVGTTGSYGSSDQDVWLVRLNSTGHQQWHQFFGGVLDDYGKGLVECDVGFAVTGTTQSYGSGNGDIWLVRTDDNGDELWTSEFGGSNAAYGNSIVKCQDGGFVIAGGSKNWGGSDNDAFLMKVPDSPVWLEEPIDQELEYGVALSYDLDVAATYVDEWWIDDDYQFSIDADGVITNDIVLPVGDHVLQIWVNDTLGNSLTDTITVTVTYTPSSRAWDPLWQRTFGGTANDIGQSIIWCENGDLVIAGYGNSYGAGGDDAWLARYDRFGNLFWSQTYGGGTHDRAHSVVECDNGDFVLAGMSASVNQAYGYQAWVFRTDSVGTMIWDYNFGGSFSDNATAVCQTSDGGFAVTGYSTSASTAKDLILFKVNATGHLEWERTNVDAEDQEGLSVIEFSDGDIYAVGYDASGTTVSTRRGLAFRTDADGNSPLATTYTDTARVEFWDVLENGSYLVVTGIREDSGDLDVYWASIYEITLSIALNDYFGGTADDYGVSIIETTNGEFIIVGKTLSYGVDGVDAIIIRLDSSGGLEWYHTYGGAGDDYGSSIIEYNDGGYAFVGFSDSIGAGSYDVWLARVQPVQWVEIPVNQTIEYEQGIDYDFTVRISQSVSLDDYLLDDTSQFGLVPRSGNFTLTNSSVTPVGTYNLILWVNDTNGEFLNISLQIVVEPSAVPAYTEPPTDQISEFGVPFVYNLIADDTAGIDTWWLNDTGNFAVSSGGSITNATALPIGIYGIELEVTDILGNTATDTFDIIVMDTTPPSWVNEPEDVYLVHGEDLDYDIGAWDLSGVDMWWVNDTVNFNTTQDGIVTSLHTLDVGTYGLQINANDTEGQVATAEITVYVQIDPPIWIIEPSNRFAEYAQPFSYSLIASSLAGLDIWWMNDTSNFAIDDLGVITNTTNLEIGTYGISVWVQDIWEQRISAEFMILVRDSVAPTWIDAPTDQTVEFGDPLNIVFSAWDESNISHWSIDDTTHFGITSVGRLVNITTLTPGTYPVTVSVFDTLNNYRSEVIGIIVTESDGPTWTVVPTDQTVELGSDLSYELQVYDYSGIGSFTLSDDANFQVNAEGVLSNALPLQVGVYELEVWVTDTIGNTVSATFNIIVEDTTPPIWIEGPVNQGLLYGEHLQVQMSAWDMSGIGEWTVSDQVQFRIDNNGLLRDTDDLQAGVHHVNVTVYDIYGNGLTTEFIVVVRALEAGGPDISLAAVVVLGVTGAVMAVMLSAYFLVRRSDIATLSKGSTDSIRATRGKRGKG